MSHTDDQLSERLVLLRDLILDASQEILDRDGLGLTVEAISYSRVFSFLEREHGIRITGGSVHGRIWDHHDDYRSEVLTRATGQSSPFEGSHVVQEVVLGILSDLDGKALEHRDRVRAFCRIAGIRLLHTYLESDTFGRFQAIKAMARSVPDEAAGAQLRAMVAEQADGQHPNRINAFRFLFDVLGLRPRRDLGLDVNEAVGACMTLVQMLLTGSHLDYHAGYTMIASKVETGMEAEEDWPWTYFGLGLLASINFLFEEDTGDPHPDDDPPEALAVAAPLISEDQPPALADLVVDKPRRTREELRELLVTAGVELLLRNGVALRADSVNYASVFDHIKRTRGVTLYRSLVHKHIWVSQDDFRLDVLAKAAHYHADDSLTTARQVMAAQPQIRHADGSINFRQIVLDSTRALVQAQMLVSARSVSFRRWQSIKASLLSNQGDEQSAALRQAVHDRYDELVAELAAVYRSVIPAVGLRVDPSLQMSDDQAHLVHAVLGATFTSGAEYNISAGATLAADTIPIPRVDGSGRSDDWPIQAIASMASLDLMFPPAG